MANFTTRVELHNHDSGDYDLLHEEMRKEQFYRVIKGNDGLWYDLPTAEYNKISILATSEIFNSAKKAAKIVIDKKSVNDREQAKDFWIIVTKADGSRAWKLQKTTKSSNLPPGERL